MVVVHLKRVKTLDGHPGLDYKWGGFDTDLNENLRSLPFPTKSCLCPEILTQERGQETGEGRKKGET